MRGRYFCIIVFVVLKAKYRISVEVLVHDCIYNYRCFISTTNYCKHVHDMKNAYFLSSFSFIHAKESMFTFFL